MKNGEGQKGENPHTQNMFFCIARIKASPETLIRRLLHVHFIDQNCYLAISNWEVARKGGCGYNSVHELNVNLSLPK